MGDGKGYKKQRRTGERGVFTRRDLATSTVDTQASSEHRFVYYASLGSGCVAGDGDSSQLGAKRSAFLREARYSKERYLQLPQIARPVVIRKPHSREQLEKIERTHHRGAKVTGLEDTQEYQTILSPRQL